MIDFEKPDGVSAQAWKLAAKIHGIPEWLKSERPREAIEIERESVERTARKIDKEVSSWR